MFIIECLPFSKGLNKESLSYFSPIYLEAGSLLKVGIRGRSVSALVLESRDATEIKSEIKSADFQMKKISPPPPAGGGGLTTKPFLQKEFLEAVKTSATYFSASQGGLLSHLIPSFILENPALLSKTSLLEPFSKDTSGGIKKIKKAEVAVLQMEDEERYSHYRSLIREEFAKNQSVFLCLPQNEAILQVKQKLERGIESFVFGFHKDMSKKTLKEQWRGVCQSEHPILIIGTGRWLFLPRSDIGTIIIDKENDNGWKTLSRPFMDLRFFAEVLADKKNIRCIIGDSFLRVETLYRYQQGNILELESVKWRLPLGIKTTIVDLRETTKKTPQSMRQTGEFKVLSESLLKLIKETVEKGVHMFIFAARKGLSPITICRDCGEQVRCFNCRSAMVLYKTRSGAIFKCHQCDETRDAAEVCQNCQSWKLSAYGSGIDKVAEEIRKEIPNINLFEIHKDIVSTNAKASKIIKEFYETRGAILLGTEMVFPYLSKKINNSAIASFDSLFSIPDFRIREKIFRLILQTKNLAKENFLIQTRNPDDETVRLAVSGDLLEFYKKELTDRKVLEYPPYGLFIKITVRGSKNLVARETENLKNVFKDYSPILFNSIHEKKGEQMAVNVIIKMPKEKWVDNALLSLLKSLSPHFEIKVDPDNLL